MLPLILQSRSVSHRDLEMTLRAELAVVEWRMAMKLAGIHKKNRIADLFPLKVCLDVPSPSTAIGTLFAAWPQWLASDPDLSFSRLDNLQNSMSPKKDRRRSLVVC